ncbi:arabinan endo-1,5-alpha-L-arabinosidase [Sphingomonas crusticola]|uniref:arabinan endo-1,5-alpha-L-arabinosidase n=1 Tax=Sphingomonas crusticola TaxID=1697973 RepID=UPI001F08525D|nr:arabinan endo-1,5-alpha-L-arabinosidase [Sphingomonas crusticola]
MNHPTGIRGAMVLAIAGIGLLAPDATSAQRPAAISLADTMTGDIAPVHDPAIIRQADTYYVFSTSRPREEAGQIPIRISKDLIKWTRAGAVFAQMPDWAKREIPKANGIWAPDISFQNGEYRLYYAASTFGSNHSVIGLATSPTLDPNAPDYKWTDKGAVIASSLASDFNAIDPAAFTDRDGKAWLAFGSFWTGLKLIRLDPATGLRATEDQKVYSLARRTNSDAIEAPFLIEHGGYYYLFASNDACCRGVNSTYYTVVGRSKDVTGPYVDHDGKPMMQGYGQIVLHGNLDPSHRWRGPGHPAILHDGNRFFIAYHAYDAQHGGIPTLRINPIGWTGDGWPVARP